MRGSASSFGLALAAAFAVACAPTLSSSSTTFLARLAEGTRAERHGRDLEAARAYGRAAAAADRRVDRDEALYRQSRSLIDADRARAALPILDRLAATRPVSRRTVRALYDSALLRLGLGFERRARADLERLVRRHPDTGLAARALATLLRVLDAGDAPGPNADGEASPPRADSRGDALLASLVRDRRVSASELGDNVLYEQARRREGRRDIAGARRALSLLVDRYPYPFGQLWDDALWNLARLDVQSGRPRDALGHLERMVAVAERSDFNGSYIRPRMSAAQLRIGEILRDELHDLDGALAAFRALPSRFPDSIHRDDAMLAVADILRTRGDRDEACALYRRVGSPDARGRAARAARAAASAHCGAPER